MNAEPSQSPISHTAPATEAIPALMQDHGGQIYGLALRLCGDQTKAEDLVQETFLQAYRKWHQFEGRSKPSTWLYTIAARLCQRMQCKKSHEPDRVLSLDMDSAFSAGTVPDIPSNDDDPQRLQMRSELHEHLEHAIVHLPRTYRMPLILKDILGFSVQEVAEVLGLKESTVKTRLHRARLVLREELSGKIQQRDAPPAAYTKRVCMDLLRSKQEALDRGVEFPAVTHDICERCSAMFASMDLTRDMCMDLSQQSLPESVSAAVLKDIAGTD